MSAEKQKRKLVAILSANAVEYGRLMGEDEAGTSTSRHQLVCSRRETPVASKLGQLAEFAKW
jgi:hypothetical protein